MLTMVGGNRSSYWKKRRRQAINVREQLASKRHECLVLYCENFLSFLKIVLGLVFGRLIIHPHPNSSVRFPPYPYISSRTRSDITSRSSSSSPYPVFLLLREFETKILTAYPKHGHTANNGLVILRGQSLISAGKAL